MTKHPHEGRTSPIIQPASTIMLLRHHGRLGIQALVLKRSEQLKFAAGYWVFPGGKIELSEIQATSSMEEAAKVAAVRETHEETGLIVDKDSLTHYVHWTTPTGGNRRFGTWFYYAWIDADKVQVDNSEIIDYKWVSVKQAFTLLHQNKLPILPPTYISLLRISPFHSRVGIDHEMSTGIPKVVPKTRFIDGKFYSFYEGDVAYLNKDPQIDGPRHRIIGDLQKGEYEFQYADCEHIFPVSGRSVLKL